ncbi:hypothetical protein ACHAWF_001429 [Thalassiosira exigua]
MATLNMSSYYAVSSDFVSIIVASLFPVALSALAWSGAQMTVGSNSRTKSITMNAQKDIVDDDVWEQIHWKHEDNVCERFNWKDDDYGWFVDSACPH